MDSGDVLIGRAGDDGSKRSDRAEDVVLFLLVFGISQVQKLGAFATRKQTLHNPLRRAVDGHECQSHESVANGMQITQKVYRRNLVHDTPSTTTVPSKTPDKNRFNRRPPAVPHAPLAEGMRRTLNTTKRAPWGVAMRKTFNTSPPAPDGASR